MHDAFLKSVFGDRRMAEILIRHHAPEWATYSALALEGIAAGPDYRPGDPLPGFVCLVLYHGDGPWTAPTSLADLFRRSDPRRYRLVPWGEGRGDDRSRGDLTALVLGLAGLMVESVGTMLELRDYPARLKKGGAKTMAEVVDRFRQGMDELVRRGARQGEARVLRRQVTRRFGEDTAGRLSRILDGPPAPEDIDRVMDALVECATGDEFIKRVRMG